MLAALASAPVVRAEVASPSVQIIVMRPTDFPLLTPCRWPVDGPASFQQWNDLTFISSSSKFDRIVILDVTDPAELSPSGPQKLETPAPFDFIKPLGGSAALVLLSRPTRDGGHRFS